MFLKAVLAVPGVGYERTRDIERLTSLVSNSGLEPPLEIDQLAQLTPWAVERRYGDPFDPEPLDRQWALERWAHLRLGGPSVRVGRLTPACSAKLT